MPIEERVRGGRRRRNEQRKKKPEELLHFLQLKIDQRGTLTCFMK